MDDQQCVCSPCSGFNAPQRLLNAQGNLLFKVALLHIDLFHIDLFDVVLAARAAALFSHRRIQPDQSLIFQDLTSGLRRMISLSDLNAHQPCPDPV